MGREPDVFETRRRASDTDVVQEHEIVAFKKLKPRGGFRLPVWQDGLNHRLLLCHRSPLFDAIADRAFGVSAARPAAPALATPARSPRCRRSGHAAVRQRYASRSLWFAKTL